MKVGYTRYCAGIDVGGCKHLYWWLKHIFLLFLLLFLSMPLFLPSSNVDLPSLPSFILHRTPPFPDSLLI